MRFSHLGAENVERALSEASGIHVLDLDLSSNGLDADVLPPLLGPAFSRLRTLRLKYNRLTDLPVAALPHLDQLEVLELDGNQIAAVDEAALVAVPASLRHLSLSSNGLARLPDGLGVSACRALTHLDLSNNPLTSLPDSLGSCARLSHLDVSSCRLTALPASLAGARSLQRLFCQVSAHPAQAQPQDCLPPLSAAPAERVWPLRCACGSLPPCRSLRQNNDLERVPPALGSLALKEWNLRANRLPPRHQQVHARPQPLQLWARIVGGMKLRVVPCRPLSAAWPSSWPSCERRRRQSGCRRLRTTALWASRRGPAWCTDARCVQGRAVGLAPSPAAVMLDAHHWACI